MSRIYNRQGEHYLQVCESALNLHYFYWPPGGDSSGYQNIVRFYGSLWENDPTSHLI